MPASIATETRTDSDSLNPESPPSITPESTPAVAKPKISVQPVLEKLFELYPRLFGARFLPLKLGVFQDLMAAHPDQFDKASLKMALGRHTRSTAYLQCVAQGQSRYDLQGAVAGSLAPEHILMAILELHQRRQAKSKEDLRPRLGKQLANAYRNSGMGRQDYLLLAHMADADTLAQLETVITEVDEAAARQAALLRAYEASGKSVDEFADMYGVDRRDVLAAFKSQLGGAGNPG